MLLHNQLSVVENESAEEDGASVESELKDGERSEKHVQNGSEKEQREHAAEET